MKNITLLFILIAHTHLIFAQTFSDSENVALQSMSSEISTTVSESSAMVNTLPYLQGFEGATFLPLDWQAFGSNTNAAWQRSTTVGAYGSSSASAFFDNFTTNLTGNYYGMRAVPLDLTGTTNPTLTFDVAYCRRSAASSDRLGIWYSYNGTSNWQNLTNFEHSTLTTAPDQTTYFTPTNTQWDSITIDLTQFAGTAFVRFAFENNTRNGNVLYIDNVHFYDRNPSSSIDEIDLTPFTLHPNPSSGRFSLSSVDSNRKIKAIHIYNLVGQSIQNIEISQWQQQIFIDLTSEQQGIYFVSITSDTGVVQTIKVSLIG